MQLSEKPSGSVVKLEPRGDALIRLLALPEEWLLRWRGASVVALDMQNAEFVSTVFLAGCVEVALGLSAAGQRFALFNVSAHQQHLLELVEGYEKLPVFRSTGELHNYVSSHLKAPEHRLPDEGLCQAEKALLWDRTSRSEKDSADSPTFR